MEPPTALNMKKPSITHPCETTGEKVREAQRHNFSKVLLACGGTERIRSRVCREKLTGSETRGRAPGKG